MKRKAYWMTNVVACLLSTSCASIVGTWHRDTSTQSQGKFPQNKFPIDVVTFSEAGSFTATGNVQTDEHTWTGTYRLEKGMLTFMPNHQMPKSFSAKITSGDKLIMTSEHDRDTKEVSFHRLLEP